MARSSFGLQPEDKEYIYEEIFQLVEHCKFGWNEAWDTPIVVRKWWINRKTKENTKQQRTGPPEENLGPFGKYMKGGKGK